MNLVVDQGNVKDKLMRMKHVLVFTQIINQNLVPIVVLVLKILEVILQVFLALLMVYL